MKQNRNKAKKKAWDAMSIYVRTKECRETTGLDFVGECFTCDRRLHITALDAGHFVAGRRNSILFDERGVHIQCSWWCNRLNHGQHKIYRKRMIEKFGIEVVEEIEQNAKKVIQDVDMHFEEIEEKYKQKLKELKGEQVCQE